MSRPSWQVWPFRERADSRVQELVDPRSLELQALLAEYNTVRQESMSSITNRTTIANFVFGALAVIIAALVAQDRPNWASAVVSFVLVPQISKTGLLIWLGEYQRSQRAGRWVALVEMKINRVVGHQGAMSWESSLVSKGLHMGYPYLATALLLMGTGWAGGGVGLYLIFDLLGTAVPLSHRIVIAVVLGTIIIGVESWYALFFRARWREIRQNYAHTAPPLEPANI